MNRLAFKDISKSFKIIPNLSSYGVPFHTIYHYWMPIACTNSLVETHFWSLPILSQTTHDTCHAAKVVLTAPGLLVQMKAGQTPLLAMTPMTLERSWQDLGRSWPQHRFLGCFGSGTPMGLWPSNTGTVELSMTDNWYKVPWMAMKHGKSIILFDDFHSWNCGRILCATQIHQQTSKNNLMLATSPKSNNLMMYNQY